MPKFGLQCLCRRNEGLCRPDSQPASRGYINGWMEATSCCGCCCWRGANGAVLPVLLYTRFQIFPHDLLKFKPFLPALLRMSKMLLIREFDISPSNGCLIITKLGPKVDETDVFVHYSAWVVLLSGVWVCKSSSGERNGAKKSWPTNRRMPPPSKGMTDWLRVPRQDRWNYYLSIHYYCTVYPAETETETGWNQWNGTKSALCFRPLYFSDAFSCKANWEEEKEIYLFAWFI